jgi:hypothetical protein
LACIGHEDVANKTSIHASGPDDKMGKVYFPDPLSGMDCESWRAAIDKESNLSERRLVSWCWLGSGVKRIEVRLHEDTGDPSVDTCCTPATTDLIRTDL